MIHDAKPIFVASASLFFGVEAVQIDSFYGPWAHRSFQIHVKCFNIPKCFYSGEPHRSHLASEGFFFNILPIVFFTSKRFLINPASITQERAHDVSTALAAPATHVSRIQSWHRPRIFVFSILSLASHVLLSKRHVFSENNSNSFFQIP
jgi:hypothetical protein